MWFIVEAYIVMVCIFMPNAVMAYCGRYSCHLYRYGLIVVVYAVLAYTAMVYVVVAYIATGITVGAM